MMQIISCAIFLLSLNCVVSAAEKQPLRSDSSVRISERKCKDYTEGVKCKAFKITDDYYDEYVEDAKITEFPHMVTVLWKSPKGKYDETCDGTLISPNFVLVPAHCSEQYYGKQEDQSTLVVRLGNHVDQTSQVDGITQIENPVKSVYKYPKYNTPYEYHDIGLLELTHDVTFTDYIRPACLWNGERFFEHNQTSITSWITSNRFSLEHPKDLQKFHVKIMTNEDCRAKGQGGVGDTQICATYPLQLNDTHCLDRSGAPLQVISEESPCVSQVVGVASFATVVCGDLPAMFARVSSYLDWIESVVWSHE